MRFPVLDLAQILAGAITPEYPIARAASAAIAVGTGATGRDRRCGRGAPSRRAGVIVPSSFFPSAAVVARPRYVPPGEGKCSCLEALGVTVAADCDYPRRHCRH